MPQLSLVAVDVRHDVIVHYFVVAVVLHRLHDHGALIRAQLVVVEPQLSVGRDGEGKRHKGRRDKEGCALKGWLGVGR